MMFNRFKVSNCLLLQRNLQHTIRCTLKLSGLVKLFVAFATTYSSCLFMFIFLCQRISRSLVKVFSQISNLNILNSSSFSNDFKVEQSSHQNHLCYI